MNVRAAAPADVEAIATIHVAAWRAAYRGHMPDAYLDSLTVEQRSTRWANALARSGPGHIAVAEQGFCYYGPTRDKDLQGGEIYALYVHPDAWRQGTGRALCQHAERHAASLELDTVTLWVLKANEPARRFYERMGYAPDGAERTNTRLIGTPLHEMRYRRNSVPGT
jgi:ribosomal protein S18 acetylase RimI-like enzyme